MLFVQRDDMVENLSAAASYPAFRSAVLPRRLQTCALRLQASTLQKGNHIDIEFRVVIEDGITICHLAKEPGEQGTLRFDAQSEMTRRGQKLACARVVCQMGQGLSPVAESGKFTEDE